MESCVFWIFVWIGGPWYEFLEFLPRVWLLEVLNHQYKCGGVVLGKFHVGFEE